VPLTNVNRKAAIIRAKTIHSPQTITLSQLATPPDIRGQGFERRGVDAVPPRNWITPSLPEETNQIPNDDRQSCDPKTVSEQKAHRWARLTDFLTLRQFAFLPKSHPQPSLKRAVLVIFGFLSIVADTFYITAFATKKNLCLT
jgi:hypothetical protein